ncbi:MAG: ATP phosphoribosyltransferase regulatory subunit [Caldilineaceae bacterium]
MDDLQYPSTLPGSPPYANGQIAGHIPRGVADYFWNDATQRRQLEVRLLNEFRRWGYTDLIPPTIEYADTLKARANADLQTKIYSFLDHDGKTLALRPDMTISAARLVGTRLHDAPMPQRFCYVGAVFRHTEPQAGQQREYWQAGVELIGANSPEADAEVLALTATAFQSGGVADFFLVVGQMHFFFGLLDELRLTPPHQAQLLQAIERKSEPELAEFLQNAPLESAARRAVERLLELHGADPLHVIDQARTLSLNAAMHESLDNLQAIYQVLDAYGVADRIHLDLTEIRDLGYYTGITFQAFTPELGFPIAGGGRYDNLIGTFGAPKPAVGVAVGIDRLLLAQRLQKSATAAENRPPRLLVAANHNPACYQIIQEWRAQGAIVIIDVNGRTGAELIEAARAQGANLALSWTGRGFDVYDVGQPSAPTHHVTGDDKHMIEKLIQSPNEGIYE